MTGRKNAARGKDGAANRGSTSIVPTDGAGEQGLTHVDGVKLRALEKRLQPLKVAGGDVIGQTEKSLKVGRIEAEQIVAALQAEEDTAEREAQRRSNLRELFQVWDAVPTGRQDKDDKPITRRQFVAPNLGRLLHTETPVATGADGSLYTYADGYYHPEGEWPLSRRIKWVLHEEWSPTKEDDTLKWLKSKDRLNPTPSATRVNLANGVYDLMAGRLDPHDPSELTPVQLAAEFDPEAKAPCIEAFLADVLPDAEDRALFYEIAGYMLVPDNTMQKAFMFIGSGANGKSTALSLIEGLLGPRNVSHVSLQQLSDDRFAAAGLDGKLANVFADLDHRALASSSMFKSITGGDTIQVERKFRESYNLRPYARLLFSANEPPPSPDGTKAMRRRWVVLPFEREFTGADADPGLLAKLTTPEELSGFLNLALNGLHQLRERGTFRETAASEAAAEKFRRETDTVAGFVAEGVTFTGDTFEKGATLYRAYEEWCRAAGKHPLGRDKFYNRLREDHPELRWAKRAGYNGFHGLALIERDHDAASGQLQVLENE